MGGVPRFALSIEFGGGDSSGDSAKLESEDDGRGLEMLTVGAGEDFVRCRSLKKGILVGPPFF